GILRCIANAVLGALVGWQLADLRAAESDPAAADRKQSGDALDDRGATGAVPPDQRDHFVVADIDRHVVQDVRRTAQGVDVVDLEQEVVHAHADSGAASRMLATSLFALISSGGPSARKRPSCIITMRSE